MTRMNNLHELTLFAPSNEAWMQPHLQPILADPVALQKVLDLHLVEKNLTVDYIIAQNKESVSFVLFLLMDSG